MVLGPSTYPSSFSFGNTSFRFTDRPLMTVESAVRGLLTNVGNWYVMIACHCGFTANGAGGESFCFFMRFLPIISVSRRIPSVR